MLLFYRMLIMVMATLLIHCWCMLALGSASVDALIRNERRSITERVVIHRIRLERSSNKLKGRRRRISANLNGLPVQTEAPLEMAGKKDNDKCANGKSDKSCAPSAAPSDFPTPAPTISLTPTNAPSPEPTPAPTESHQPTAAPSNMPSDVPSASPTATPTPAPSPTPTVSPTTSTRPTVLHTGTPTRKPTIGPTATRFPTESPTDSAMPTSMSTTVYETTSVANGWGLDTECSRAMPPMASPLQSQLVDFDYVLNVLPDANMSAVLLNTELDLHDYLVQQYLDCQFLASKAFYVYSLSSLPRDSVDLAAICATSEQRVGATCYVVHGQFLVKLFYIDRPTRRLQNTVISDPNVAASFNETLAEFFGNENNGTDPGVVSGGYNGLTNDQSGATDPNGVQGGDNTIGGDDDSNAGAIAGGTIGALAGAFVLVGVLLLGLRRSKEYSMEHQSMDSDGDPDLITLEEDAQQRQYILGDDDQSGVQSGGGQTTDDDESRYGLSSIVMGSIYKGQGPQFFASNNDIVADNADFSNSSQQDTTGEDANDGNDNTDTQSDIASTSTRDESNAPTPHTLDRRFGGIVNDTVDL